MLPNKAVQFSKSLLSLKPAPSIEYKLVFIVLFFCILLFSNDTKANHQKGVSVYFINERNAHDSIIGLGVSALQKVNNTNFGFVVDSSLSNAEVVDKQGYVQHYLAWELGGKIGYFSDIFLYGEFGFDFGELAFQDRDEEHYEGYSYRRNDFYDDESNYALRAYNNDYSNDIDAYAGIGAGINLGHIELTAFARYRQIDGEYWKANNQTFTGFKAAIVF